MPESNKINIFFWYMDENIWFQLFLNSCRASLVEKCQDDNSLVGIMKNNNYCY